MNRLAAFADEISPDLDEQIAVLTETGIALVELRSIGGINVLDLSDEHLDAALAALDRAGIGVAAIGSPIGKVPIDASRTDHLHRFERALEVALRCRTRLIRLFSFYAPEHTTMSEAERRTETLDRLAEYIDLASQAGIILVHENEKDIYGDTIARCHDLLTTLDSPSFRAAFDPANFIQCGQEPYPAAYEALRPCIAHVHVKDALTDGTVVPAGVGAARWPEILAGLRATGYDGIFSLEPHLEAAGPLGGFSGPERFRLAVQAFTGLTQRSNLEDGSV